MNSLKKIVIIATLVVGCLSLGGDTVITIDLAGLEAEKLGDRERAAESIRQERAGLVKRLIELAGAKVEPLPSSSPRFVSYPWHDSKHLSILLLGDLRATEAIPVLLDNLEYKNPKSIDGGYLDIGGAYPAAEALSKIGMPAVEAIVERLGDYDPKSNRSKICRWIIEAILGTRLARTRLEIAIEETREANVKENLRAALPHFKTLREKLNEEKARREKAKEP